VNLPEPDEGEWTHGIIAGSGNTEIFRIEVVSE
jgi:hypothetical protein